MGTFDEAIYKKGIKINEGGRFFVFTYTQLMQGDNRGTHLMHFFAYIPWFKKQILVNKYFGKKGTRDIGDEVKKYGLGLKPESMKKVKDDGVNVEYTAEIEINHPAKYKDVNPLANTQKQKDYSTYDLLTCPVCKKKFKKIDKHTYETVCRHYPENMRVSKG